jgi:hypothetical protein
MGWKWENREGNIRFEQLQRIEWIRDFGKIMEGIDSDICWQRIRLEIYQNGARRGLVGNW